MTTVEVYDPDADSWEAKANMPTSRTAFAAAAVNGKIYAIGGDSSWLARPMKIVEEYDPATDTWIRKADMPTARSYRGCGRRWHDLRRGKIDDVWRTGPYNRRGLV